MTESEILWETKTYHFGRAQSVVIISNNITIDCLSYNNVVFSCLPVLEQLRVWKIALVWSNISVISVVAG